MGKILNTIAFSIIIMLSFATKAHSTVLKSQFVGYEVKAQIIEQLKAQYDSEKIEVEIKALPYKSIRIPDGKFEIRTSVNFRTLNSSSIVKVKIFVNSEQVKSFGVRAGIKIYDKVWVAQDWIKRGSSLSNVVLKEKDISSVLNNIVKKDFNPYGYRARRNIKPGEVINFDYIEEIPTIVKDSPVSLIFQTPQVSITIPGIALTAGKTGDYIKVKNLRYRKKYVGKIIGANLVLINI